MNHLNSIIVEGNLVRDVDFRVTKSGKPVSSFSVAVSRSYKSDGEYRRETSFFEVEAWGRNAEVSRSMGTKGRLVRVVGRLRQDRWQDTEGGNHSKALIVAEHLDFAPECKGCKKQGEEAPEESAYEEAAVE